MDLVINCNVSGIPLNLTWIHSGGRNLTGLSQTLVRTDVIAERLIVGGASHRDGGTHMCVVSNQLGSESTSITVEVVGKFCLDFN